AFLLGQCGIISLAQSVFYGIGAYATAYGATALGWHWLVGLGAGMLVSGATAFLIGWPILRLSGHFLALATLALATIGHVLFLE
ncbi:ABC transporter permease subunit, partial [Stenotrophomonas maltophilia]|uniref:ABC transporter permease subunit n=1 Tax=Stenotrophomonas maltophilia TaxID=40324 RepID=UPI003CCFE860